jgi:hypothetical protein
MVEGWVGVPVTNPSPKMAEMPPGACTSASNVALFTTPPKNATGVFGCATSSVVNGVTFSETGIVRFSADAGDWDVTI